MNMLKSVGVGLLVSLFLGMVSICLVVLGSYLKALTGSDMLGMLVTFLGYIYLATGLPFISLIDFLPMHLLFQEGGPAGIFGSVILFAIIVWSFVFSLLAQKKWWPFNPKGLLKRIPLVAWITGENK